MSVVRVGSNQKNIYVVRSSKPKLLVYNQFEEIISECNLLIEYG